MPGVRDGDDHQVGGAGDVDVRAALHRDLGPAGGRQRARGDLGGHLGRPLGVTGAEQDPLPRGRQPHREPAALRAGAAEHPDDQLFHRAPVRHVSPSSDPGLPGVPHAIILPG